MCRNTPEYTDTDKCHVSNAAMSKGRDVWRGGDSREWTAKSWGNDEGKDGEGMGGSEEVMRKVAEEKGWRKKV